MIVLFYITLYFFFLFITYFKFGTLFRANNLFNTMWSLGAIVVLYEVAGLYPVSLLTHMYIVFSILSFNIVYLLFSKKTFKFQMNIDRRDLKLKYVYLLNISSYFFLIPILINAIKIIINLGWDSLRLYAFRDSDILASALQLRIVSWIVYPIFLSTILLAVILAVKKVKIPFLYVIATLNLLSYTISFGGRNDIIKTFFYFILTFLVLKSTNIKKVIIPKKYIFYGICILSITFYLTTLRSLKGLNFIENALVYFFGSLSYFDVLIHSPEFSTFHDSLLFGTGVLGFLINPLLYIGMMIFGIPNYTSEYLVKIVTDNYIFISENFRYNAMSSALYPFWRDGKGVGIVIGMMVFSIIVVVIENKYYNNRNLRSFSLYIFILFIVFSSVMNYELLTIRTFMNIVFIITFTRPLTKAIKVQNNRGL
ncbi:O-antigen polymerase [Peribacillus sp. NPDC097225]|uniref:O-antigen polymerase n=1 Tax=Peribacillus sp. NPDC097225 TaxID=3364400 RepID=UPI003803D4F8